MKKTAHAFLTIQKILFIIYIVVFAICFVTFLFIGVPMMVINIAHETEEQIALFATGSVFTYSSIFFLFALPIYIVALCLLRQSKDALETAKSRKEARKGAIIALIVGVITEGYFAIAAGVMMLVMKNKYYDDTVIDD